MDNIFVSLKGEHLLHDPFLNKGSAFTEEERKELGLHGLLPYHVSSIEEQVKRRYENFCELPGDLEKYVFLSALQNRNETLFYRLMQEHVSEMLPLIYTPTVGEASTRYSSIYSQHRGIYLSYPLRDQMEEMIRNIPKAEVDVIVVTDGERILGLGDLGAGGMAISVGKLSLYVLFGGLNPSRTLPILLDVGTNNRELLKDPLYIGWRHPRISGKEYEDFVDRFIQAIKHRYPRVLLQWEDFAKPHALPLLERYRTQICSFNDDIQGTAAVVLSALFSAIKIGKSSLQEQRIVVLGGGSAGIGICRQLLNAMKEEGSREEAARKNFYIIDIQGLVHTQLSHCESEQKEFAQDFSSLARWTVNNPSHITLLEVIKHVRPTILIGVSAQPGAFTEEIVTEMACHVERPIILPLSNPQSRCEAHPEDLIKWTKGKAIIAMGSPFADVHFEGKSYPISQCNNVYIFPGVGLGVIASGSTQVSDRMFLKAASILSQDSPMLKNPQHSLFPSFEHLLSISRSIAKAVAVAAQEEGFAPKSSLQDIERKIARTSWAPVYANYLYENKD